MNPKDTEDAVSANQDHILVQIVNLEALLGVSRQNLGPATLQAMNVLHTCKILSLIGLDFFSYIQQTPIAKSPLERKRLLHHLRDAMSKIEPNGRMELLRMLVRPDEKGEHMTAESLLMLQQVVLAHKGMASAKPESKYPI